MTFIQEERKFYVIFAERSESAREQQYQRVKVPYTGMNFRSWGWKYVGTKAECMILINLLLFSFASCIFLPFPIIRIFSFPLFCFFSPFFNSLSAYFLLSSVGHLQLSVLSFNFFAYDVAVCVVCWRVAQWYQLTMQVTRTCTTSVCSG